MEGLLRTARRSSFLFCYQSRPSGGGVILPPSVIIDHLWSVLLSAGPVNQSELLYNFTTTQRQQQQLNNQTFVMPTLPYRPASGPPASRQYQKSALQQPASLFRPSPLLHPRRRTTELCDGPVPLLSDGAAALPWRRAGIPVEEPGCSQQRLAATVRSRTRTRMSLEAKPWNGGWKWRKRKRA